MYKNREGYSDPTAGTAMSRVMKEYKQERKARWRREQEVKSRPKVYIVSPYAGDTERNVEKAIGYCAYAIRQNHIPVASHLLYPAILNDVVQKERELGIMFGLALLAVCDEVWVFGTRRSEGMKAEIAEAKRLNKPIRYFEEVVQNEKSKQRG